MLLVDPEASSREPLAGLLGQFADGPIVAIGSADEGLAALGAAAAGPAAAVQPGVEVALVDLSLWGSGGLELVEALRAADSVAPIPVIVLVTEETEHLVDAALAAGATDLLYRPIRPRELAARVHSAVRFRRDRLEGARRERHLAEQSRELLDTNHRLERLVCVDPLTGLANRRHLMSILAGEWRRAGRTGRALSALLIDLDHFHAYNECHGHPGGDACLRRVSEALAAELRRPSDLIGRYGGEEFVAVLPDTDAAGALTVAERLRAAIEGLGLPHAGSPHGVVTASIGVATARPEEGREPEGLVAEADRALYSAKSDGRNRAAVSGGPPVERGARRPAGCAAERWPAPVWMDPVFADRLPGAIEEMRRAIRMAGRAAGAGEMTLVRQIAGELDGAAGQFGLEAIQKMARALEQAAASGDGVEIEAVSEELRWYLDRVPVVYRACPLEAAPLSRAS